VSLTPAHYDCRPCGRRFGVAVDGIGPNHPAEAQVALVLLHATCPGCGAKNPDGVVAERRENTRTRWGTAAFFAVIAAVSVAWPPLALIVPALWLLILVLMRVFAGGPRIAVLALQAAFVAGAVAFVLLLPRYAFAIPASLAIRCALWSPRAGDGPFERAAKRLRFDATPYRG
jgi:hypothetical protein